MTEIHGKTSHVHGTEDNIVKMTILLKLIYRFNTPPIKSLCDFIAEIKPEPQTVNASNQEEPKQY